MVDSKQYMSMVCISTFLVYFNEYIWKDVSGCVYRLDVLVNLRICSWVMSICFGTLGFAERLIDDGLADSFRSLVEELYLFSIFLLLKMLNQGWNGSLMYPMVNVTVLLLSTIVAVIAFHEKLNRINWIGIGLASASILTIAYAHNSAG